MRISDRKTGKNKLIGVLAFTAIAAAAGLRTAEAGPSADRTVIDELRKLRASLPTKDGQSRELDLRIADLLANECLITTRGTPAQRQKDCTDATILYKSTLDGASPSLQSKVRFQMARIALERGKTDEAKPLFETVLAQSEMIDLKREAALRLAEILESSPATARQAEGYYQKALELCQAGDSCSFAHYRIAWIRKKEGRLAEAIAEMKLGLVDSKGQARQESVRDLIVFMGQDSGPAANHIAFVDELGTRLSQPQLLQELAYGYLTTGNKANGVQALEIVNARGPTISNGMKILEEIYGLRDWDRFAQQMSQIETLAQNPANVAALEANATDRENLEKIAKRLAIQLDGERTTRTERAAEFKQFSLLTLTLFPKTADRARIMEGFVAAEKDPAIQIAKIREWTSNEKYALSRDEKISLHELRVGIAQKTKNHAETIAALNDLLALKPSQDKARSYQYGIARALYEEKNYAQALPQFKTLAASGLELSGGPDEFAIQSQNLALDILNQQKDLDALSIQAKSWTENAKLKSNPKLAKELAEMGDVSSQADFQQAVALGETDAALTRFRGYCEAGRFTPKSCDNAKTLAVRLNRHTDLIAVLRIQSKGTGEAAKLANEELAAELEAGGEFKLAGEMAEKALVASSAFPEYLKTALLYELAGEWSARDRVLNRLPKALASAKMKLSEPEWMALLSTVKDANLVNAAWMKLPGAPLAYRVQMAETLEAKGQSTKETQSLILAEKSSTGPAWNRHVWLAALQLSAKESKIKFHGKNGERMFQNRVTAMTAMNKAIDGWLSGSPSELRVKLLRLSQGSVDQLTREIVESPLPAELTDEQRTQIQASLTEMAKPFTERSAALGALIQEELAKVADAGEKTRLSSLAQSELQALLGSQTTTQESPTTVTASGSTADWAPILSAQARLAKNPRDEAALTELKSMLETRSLGRLSKYFEGRLAQLKQESSK